MSQSLLRLKNAHVQLMRKKESLKVKPGDLIKRWKILKGDTVMIMDGEDKGRTGKVKSVNRRTNRITVEGMNLIKRHIRKAQGQKGGIFTIEGPIHYSKVAVIDPSTGKPSKIRYKWLEDGRKVRVAKDTGTVIPLPAEHWLNVQRAKIEKKKLFTNTRKDGVKTTLPEEVKKVTYDGPQPLGLLITKNTKRKKFKSIKKE